MNWDAMTHVVTRAQFMFRLAVTLTYIDVWTAMWREEEEEKKTQWIFFFKDYFLKRALEEVVVFHSTNILPGKEQAIIGTDFR